MRSKKTRRCIAALSAFFLIFAATHFTATAFAADDGAIKTSAVWADDKNVDVTVTLARNPGLWGFTFYMNFDNTKLTLVSAAKKAVYPSLKTNADDGAGTDLTSLDRISMSWQNSDLVDDTQTGDLVTLRFQVKSGALPGNVTDFTIEIDDPDDFSNVDFDTIPINVDDSGSVHVPVPDPATPTLASTPTNTPTPASANAPTNTPTPISANTPTPISANAPIPTSANTPTPRPPVPTPVLSPSATVIRLAINNAVYTKNDVSYTSDAAPYISADSRTMVPIRLIAEAFGAKVDWDAASRTAVITQNNNTLRIVIDQPLPSDMGTAVISNDRTFVPIRYISETFGAKVDWDAQAQTVTITQ
ncbi:MAG: hypothetical protein LBT32_06325 [Peptococcaceae bacterium]|jgi:hypothetical protein|nr:hypothetical protein [Peptococcaceae bacterium]